MAPPDVSYVSLDPEINNSPEDTTSVNRENKTTLYYTLPAVRFSSVFKTLIIIDTLTSLTLWILGGNSEYFVDNIANFHFMESVFDLALLAMLKCVLSFILLDCLEIKNMLQIDKPFDWNLRRKIVMLHVTLWLLFILCVVFTFTKGGMILYAILYRESYEMMHITYNVLCICATSFTMLEFLSVLYSMRAMKKLKIYRIKHIVNEDGQEIDEEGKAIQKKVDLKRLIGLAKPESSLLAIGFICLVGASGGNMIAPLYFGKVVDAALQSMEALTKTVLILLGIYLGGSILAMFRAFTFTLAGQRVVARLRKELFNRIIKQEVAFFDKNRTGELTNRLSSDTQVVQNALTVNISMLLRNILTIIGSLGFMFALNPAMTRILLAIVPVISIATVNYGKYVKKLREKFQKKLADASTVAEECLSSMRTVRMFNCEVKSMNFYKVHIDESYILGKYLSVASGVFECLIGFLSYGAICVVLWYGGKLVNEKTLSPGILTSFLLYTLQVALSFGTLSAIYGDFMQAVGASVRIFGLLDRIPEFPDDGFYSEDRMEGCVEFHNVKFTYPSRPETEVLRGVTFSVNTGEMVALVGPSGGGKSTIVSLVERFYDPDSGKIFLGNMAINTLNPKWFRTHMSMVSQEPTLFACSIRENIAYGRDATHDEIVEVSRKANAHDFIMEFEKGYDTAVGERGIRLSGGQKQRVAIARALIMNPSILLLDEATSALDAESEHLVQEAIDRAMKGRTVIVIAHRLSTVRNATKVLVIDKGQIVEQGTHDELIANKGVYKKLVLRQLNAGAISTIDDDVQTDGNSVPSADKVAEVVEVAEGEIIKLE